MPANSHDSDGPSVGGASGFGDLGFGGISDGGFGDSSGGAGAGMGGGGFGIDTGSSGGAGAGFGGGGSVSGGASAGVGRGGGGDGPSFGGASGFGDLGFGGISGGASAGFGGGGTGGEGFGGDSGSIGAGMGGGRSGLGGQGGSGEGRSAGFGGASGFGDLGFGGISSGGFGAAIGPSASSPAGGALAASGFAPGTGGRVGLGTAVSARAAEDMSMSRYTAMESLLSTIMSAEAQRRANPATGAYDPYNGLVGARAGRRTPSHTNLTDMTITQVMDYQRGMRARGHLSTAVGAYQFTNSTLREFVAKLGIDPDTTRFTRSVQDRLAVSLIDDAARRATRNGAVDATRFGNNLAGRWAGLANSTGRSAHHGVNGNSASVGWDTVRDRAQTYADTFTGGSRPTIDGAAVTSRGSTPTPDAKPSQVQQGATPQGSGVTPVSPTPANVVPPTLVSPVDVNPTFAIRVTPDEPDTRPMIDEDVPAATTVPATAVTPNQPAQVTPNRSAPAAGAPLDQSVTDEAARTRAGKPEEERSNKPSSLAGKIAAGILDVGMGMLPGPIGLGTGIANAGLALTGRATLGDRIVTGFRDSEPGTPPEHTGEGSGNRFADTYLRGFRRGPPVELTPGPEPDPEPDPGVNRGTQNRFGFPTPEERFGRDRSSRFAELYLRAGR